MIAREAREEDVPEFARLYSDAVRAAGPEGYTAAEIDSWAGFSEEDGFQPFIRECLTLVAEDDTGIVGFSGIDGSGLIRSVYVRGDRQRRGIGSLLLTKVMEAGRADGVSHFSAVAGEFSVGLFYKFGLEVVEIEWKERRGSVFRRYLMETAPAEDSVG